MDPRLLRSGFRIGFFIVAVALATLPFQPSGSAEFVVTMLAAGVGAAMVIGVALLARLADPPFPGDRPARQADTERSAPRER